MTAFSGSSARFTAAQPDGYYVPRVYAKTRPLIVYMPGNGIMPQQGGLSAASLLNALVAQGYCVVAPNVTDLFGNATAMTRISDAITWGRANLPCTTGPVAIVGASNGAIAGIQYLRQNPTLVAAVVTLICPVDLNNIRVNDISSLRASIDTAWGVTYPAALPAHADPLTDVAAYAAVGAKVQQWISTNDPLDNATTGHTETGFAANIGAEAHSAGAVGHAETSWTGLDIPTAVQFIASRTV